MQRGNVVRAAGMVALVAGMAVCAPAQPRYWWSGISQQQFVKPSVWGNGSVSQTTEFTYDGGPVLKLQTRNNHEGVRLDFPTPFDLGPYKEKGFLRIRLRFHDAPAPEFATGAGVAVGITSLAVPPGAGGWGGPAPGAVAPGGAVGGGSPVPRVNRQLSPRLAQIAPLPPVGVPGGPSRLPGATPGGGFPAAPALGMPVLLPDPAQQTPISSIRWMFFLERGVGEVSLPIDLIKNTTDGNGWHLFDIPINTLRMTPGASGGVRRIVVTSDQEDTFYLAQMLLLTDTSNGKMTVTLRRPSDAPGTQISELRVKPGPFELIAEVATGTADPIIEWNFDADRLGILPPPALGTYAGNRVDARGAVVKFSYPNEEQDYRVQVTVRDRLNRKPPATASALVRVRG